MGKRVIAECQCCRAIRRFIRKNNVNAVEQQEDAYLFEEALFVGAVTSESQNDEWYVSTKIEKQNTKLKVDTDSQVNILNINQLKKIKPQPSLKESTHKLFSNTAVLGTTGLCVESETNQSRNLTFYVVDTNQPGLLGLRAAQELWLIKIVENTIVDRTAKKPLAHLIRKSSLVWIVWRENTTSKLIQQLHQSLILLLPTRTIPAALRSRVKEELDDMERKNVICKVEEPTDWVSSIWLWWRNLTENFSFV
ncbi:Hypothetical predicted protein [Paramuricea clavata]|uniref:Uncharacterized protein n=1 Tax=Paramuricea clavata TaxID=317549 RepID=A0A6S7L7T6_PARCT|nr:Hypothetical predicted protein [Paramuricea clavata]